ncbi:hypothetical protein R1flu_021945 [Riccia fluitans]|uniref:Enoyl-CoA hydratase/isomerase n=1 Tax=Riccia fluitans TaxID=41844 RepID=A0ABD1ZRF9_9MARC
MMASMFLVPFVNSDPEEIKILLADGSATVTFSRPKSMNSLSSATIDTSPMLSHHYQTVAKSKSSFSLAQRWSDGLCKKHIGTINGWAITAGFELALACDILIASTNAKFMDTHAKFGILPSWSRSQKLSRLVGLNRARHAHFTSMPIDSQLAEKWGLVSQVVPPVELMKTANAIAETILKNNEHMVLNIKAVVNDGANMPLGEALRLEKYIAGRRQAPSKLQFRLIHSRFICSIVVVVGYKLDC